ncbi:hypothetical protein [Allosphingosinicella vermicomposti]|uniref:hypothetical protein n=1 Tax=Allosphingosinicella vermicomposti TaxID=614671 RepID=UPI000D0F991E|nr:hypothetical protein [Allosphingosinicella vermicomposti]
MKHAKAETEQQQIGNEDGGSSRWSFSQMSQHMSDGATRVVAKARANPGAALAVGGAVVGAVAAAAVPLFRWGRDGGTADKGTQARKSASAKKSSATTKARRKKSN